MILFFDEDMGTAIPKFLRGADEDVDVLWLRARFPNENDPRRQDIGWLEEAGREGWLVVSCNKSMLKVEYERQAIVQHSVGVVFFERPDRTAGNDACHTAEMGLAQVARLDRTTPIRPLPLRKRKNQAR